MVAIQQDHRLRIQPRPSAEEIERRKVIGSQILALREKSISVAPMTTGELVRKARENEMWYGNSELDQGLLAFAQSAGTNGESDQAV